MIRKKILVLLTSGLVVAGGLGGVAAQAVASSAEAPAEATATPAETETVTPTATPAATTPPTESTHIDEFYLQGLWQRFFEVGKAAMASCMTEAGFGFDDTSFDGMPPGLSTADQDAWQAAAVPCLEERDAATAAAEAAYVPTEEERAEALAFATQYQGWIDAMRSCMADRGHEFVGAVDMTLQAYPYPEGQQATGMPDGLSPEESHQWKLDATGYDYSIPESEQSTWEASCGFVADAAYGGPGH
ncbi:hypothetical protein SAMN06295974_1951 [Plantibacter flavus]|uniref:Uncharacterized protein n=2 Tax=Plantibacter flavus TaxID=150123 RepID=A0A3N2BXQ5_9MICO|nr:hypothetical protein EDD42_0088 [Plantibacter flavus]SMG29058.1 hypothetical protein SAMN06295974_1951 [Plantibacter flavus]